MKINIMTLYNTPKTPIKLIFIAFLMLCLESCFVAKNYKTPELSETINLFRTDNLPQDSISMAAVSWKTLFQDTYLKEYIETGLQNNLDIRIAIQQINAAEAYLKQGRAGYLPSLTGNGKLTRSYISDNGQQRALLSNIDHHYFDQYELSGTLSWEADIWGKIKSNSRAYQAEYLKCVAAHQAVKTLLVAQIVNAYYTLLALDAQYKVTQESVANREKSIETIKALKAAGQVNEVAVDQAIAQFNQAKGIEVDLETAIFKTENVLSILLGKTPQTIARTTLDVQSMDTKIELGEPAYLLRARPDVKVAEYNLVQAFQLHNVAKSSLYPSLTLSGTGGFQSLELDKLININSIFANIIGGVTQPILNQRKLKTQVEVTKAQQEQALLNFKKSILTAGSEVSNALFAYNAETKKYVYLKNQVEALRKAEVNSEELLKNGYANYLDLLTVRQNALNAELDVVTSKLQQLLSVVTLYQALGGGVN